MIHVLEPSLLSPLSDLENLAGEHACSSSFPVSQKAEERLAMTLCNSSKHQDRGLMDVGSLEVYKSLLLGLLLLFYHFLALYLTFRKTRAKKLMVSGSPALLPKIKKSEQSDTCFRTLFPPPSHTKVRQPNTHVFCLLSSPLLSKKKTIGTSYVLGALSSACQISQYTSHIQNHDCSTGCLLLLLLLTSLEYKSTMKKSNVLALAPPTSKRRRNVSPCPGGVLAFRKIKQCRS
jgi:hypothetical protein